MDWDECWCRDTLKRFTEMNLWLDVFFVETHRKLHIITAVDNAFFSSLFLINDFLSDCREC